MRILLIEDDVRIAEFVRQGLMEVGYAVDWAASGTEGLRYALEGVYAACILDLMLPGLDGLALLKRVREQGIAMPVVILSAKHTVDDRVAGLKFGADDYLVKPFSIQELMARLEAVLRRNGTVSGGAQWLELGDLRLDLYNRTVSRAGRTIELKPKEFSLLCYLMQNSGQIVSKTAILEKVWGYDFDPGTNTIDVLVCRLRSKLEIEGEGKLLHTVRGAGYVLKF